MIEFDGLEEALRGIGNIADEEKIRMALNKAVLVVEDSAREKAPKGRTGDLAKFIESKVEGLTGVVFQPLKYAPYVEYGTGLFAEKGGRKDVPWRYQDEKGDWHTTSGMQPQPFMRPALDMNRDKIIEILREGLKND